MINNIFYYINLIRTVIKTIKIKVNRLSMIFLMQTKLDPCLARDGNTSLN